MRPRRGSRWQERVPVNPASLMKLLTTYAALDLLGPAWTWNTPVWLQGRIEDGVLDGDLVIKGSGDPKLVLERMWLLLRRVQQLGVREIRGDIVLDRSAFSVPDAIAGRFRRRAAAALQRATRRAAAQLQVGAADLHARRRSGAPSCRRSRRSAA